METAPDLENGYIVNGITAKNSWSTRIQAVLVRDGDYSQAAYLSQECRFENVPFSSENAASALDIIKTQRPYRFLTYSQNDSFHQLPDSDTPLLLDDVITVDLGDGLLIPSISRPDWRSQVCCPQRPIDPISPSDLLEGLNDRTIPASHVHVRIALDDGATIYCPAGYINFANRGVESAAYIQSISGDVLFSIDTTLTAGYIACAIEIDGRSKIEFVTKRFTELHNCVHSDAEKKMLRQLTESGSEYTIYLGVMNLVVDLTGDVQFFRYA